MSNINVTSLFRVILQMLFRYVRYKFFDKINTKKLKNIILNFEDPHTQNKKTKNMYELGISIFNLDCLRSICYYCIYYSL